MNNPVNALTGQNMLFQLAFPACYNKEFRIWTIRFNPSRNTPGANILNAQGGKYDIVWNQREFRNAPFG